MTDRPFDGSREFDEWAERYDEEVFGRDDFPFLGYDAALSGVVVAAGAKQPCSVLDLGIGTGNLAQRFAVLGCEIWGLDFSPKMLERAARKLPEARLGQADLRGEWPTAFRRRFEVIVSAYVFHHFPLNEKVALLDRLCRDRCAPGARIVIADLSFPTAASLAHAREKWRRAWDEEHDWVADEAMHACVTAGLEARYEQVSEIAGIYVFRPGAS